MKATEKAREFLKTYLAQGEVSYSDIKEEATHQGIAYRTLARAAKQINLRKSYRGEQYWWSLPSTDNTEQMEFLRAQIREVERQCIKLKKVIGNQQEMAHEVGEAIRAIEPSPQRTGLVLPKDKPTVLPVVVWSDWHIGEVISSEETEGFGEYNWEIAQERFDSILEDTLRWVESNRTAYNMPKIAILGLGDYVSGDIHHELMVTNEFPLPVQAAKSGMLFAHGLATLAPHFNHVDVFEIGADNHGRLVRKPQAKQKTMNNMSWLTHFIANLAVQNISNITIHQAKAMKMIADLNGWKALLEHGDGVRSQQGFPWYGMEKNKGKEAQKRMMTNKGFHLHVIGHFHVPGLVLGNTFVNGSLSGTTEFDHSCGRHAAPSQIAFMIHKEHGVFNFTPFNG